jgi:CheY-like chemotaxis protein
VTTASNGQEALDKIDLGAPDLIISETHMPDGDGFELCRRIKYGRPLVATSRSSS